MSKQEHDHERIQRYLEGELSEAEKRELEARLQEEADLREMLELHRDVDRQLGDAGLEDFRGFLEEVRAEADGNGATKKNRILPLRSLMLIAAAIVALIVAVVWLLPNRNAPQSPDQLFAEHFQSEGILIVPGMYRGVEKSLDSTLRAEWINKVGPHWVRAFELYHVEENPSAALVEFLRVEPEIQENFSTTYPIELGRLYLANGRPREALEVFRQMEESPGKQAEWYSALALLKIDPKEARKALEAISQDSDSDYEDEAGEILIQLRVLSSEDQ